MYTFILNEDDMKNASHFPVIALINEAYNTDFISFLKSICNCEGCGYDYSFCTCWEALDDYDKDSTSPFDGLMIATDDEEELILTYSDFYCYLELAQIRISKINPKLAKEIGLQLEKYKSIFGVK